MTAGAARHGNVYGGDGRGGHGGPPQQPPRAQPPRVQQPLAQQPRAPQPARDPGPAEAPRRLSADERATVVLPVVRSQYRSHRRKRAEDGTLLPESPLRKTVRATGEVFITFGLIVLLFAGYEVWGKQVEVHHAQSTLAQQLQTRWSGSDSLSPNSPPLPGGALAKIYIPRLSLALVVVQGVTLQDIRNAPGHYPDSAMPGQIGNFAIAGHREKGIFMDLNLLSQGDLIIIQTQRDWFIYKIYKANYIVLPTQVDVVNPVPDQPNADLKPSKQLITLTTCNPWWDNYQRLITHGELTRQQPTSQGEPDELGDLKGK